MIIDEDGKRRRRRKHIQPEISDGIVHFNNASDEDRNQGLDHKTRKKECPVPKPGGILGELLGFHKPNAADERSRQDR
jgi:cytochrome c oxidase assembly factor 2